MIAKCSEASCVTHNKRKPEQVRQWWKEKKSLVQVLTLDLGWKYLSVKFECGNYSGKFYVVNKVT
jgi:hypothetical protein